MTSRPGSRKRWAEQTDPSETRPGDAVRAAFSGARYDRAKLTDLVADELRAAIIDLRLPPGEPLRESAIAESLGVSKTPVREAFVRLEQAGLVETTLFKGAVVLGYTRRDLVELYELRELVEVWAVREAARSLGDDQRERLVRLMETTERLRTERRTATLERAIDEFDQFLFEQVTNRRIAALIDNMRDHLVRIGRLTAAIPGRLEMSVEQHAAIAAALLARDPDAAEIALRHHIGSVRDDQLAGIDDEAER
ncbi:MAG: GntR family transcriptional regulator [Actinomycetota bacterium]|nr:GntR family transcriptional regulator [Actinomycetota bacterium]